MATRGHFGRLTCWHRQLLTHDMPQADPAGQWLWVWVKNQRCYPHPWGAICNCFKLWHAKLLNFQCVNCGEMCWWKEPYLTCTGMVIIDMGLDLQNIKFFPVSSNLNNPIFGWPTLMIQLNFKMPVSVSTSFIWKTRNNAQIFHFLMTPALVQHKTWYVLSVCSFWGHEWYSQ